VYKRELVALKRAGRLRRRRIYDPKLKDFASNDYLGLAHNKELLERAYRQIAPIKQMVIAPKLFVIHPHPRGV